MKKENLKRLENISTVIGLFLGILIVSFFTGDETPSVKESSEPIDNVRKPYRNRLNPGILTENRSWDEVQQEQKRINACAWGRPECSY